MNTEKCSFKCTKMFTLACVTKANNGIFAACFTGNIQVDRALNVGRSFSPLGYYCQFCGNNISGAACHLQRLLVHGMIIARQCHIA